MKRTELLVSVDVFKSNYPMQERPSWEGNKEFLR